MSSNLAVDVYDAPAAELYDAPEQQEIQGGRSGLFSFKGRLSVLGYLSRTFLWCVCLFALLVLITVVAEIEFAVSDFALAAIVLAMIPVVWILFALTFKRLHDINRSGWYMLFTFVPILGSLYWLYISLTPGSSETNQYGHHVKAAGWEVPVGKISIVLLAVLVMVELYTFVIGVIAAV